MINQVTIEKILDSAQIIEVIGEFVSLKKRGVNFIGLCPFHDEKTPSFTVSPSKEIFKCFGCGKAGNVVNFIMEHEHMTYPDALRFLAKKYNVEIAEKEQTPEDIERKNEVESLMIVSSFAQKYFSDFLLNNPDGRANGYSYFAERGFREDIIEKFQLGFCPDEKNVFTNDALKQGYKLEYLVGAGLTIQRDDWIVDRFSGRVTFPIHNIAGRVIGFSARTLKSDKNIAKYLNSPDSTIYHKGNVLYGLYLAKQSIGKKDKCYIVEGNTDVISMYQSGIENVVASSGTALTTNQLKLIKRFTNNITIVFDGDEAGIKASLRGIDLALEEGLNLKVVLLPKGEDPDSFSKNCSSDVLFSYLHENEKDFIEFKLDLLLEEAKTDPIKRAGLVSDILRSVSVIPDNIIRSVYLKDCSTKLNISEPILYHEMQKLFLKKSSISSELRSGVGAKEHKPTTPLLPSFIEDVYLGTQEKEIIQYLINFGSEDIEFPIDQENYEKMSVAEYIITEIKNDDLEFKNLIYKAVFEEFELLLKEGKKITSKHFTNHQNDEIRKLAADVLSPKHKLSKRWDNQSANNELDKFQTAKNIKKAVIAFKSKIILAVEKDLTKQIKELAKTSDNEELNSLLYKMTQISEKKKILSFLLERIIL
ncbi:MAG: DNA primase [Bacteroidota bacterium]